MEDIALSGIVRDASGTPIEGVSIVSGSSAATTNTDGFFEFDQIQVVSVLNDRSVVRFSKASPASRPILLHPTRPCRLAK